MNGRMANREWRMGEQCPNRTSVAAGVPPGGASGSPSLFTSRDRWMPAMDQSVSQPRTGRQNPSPRREPWGHGPVETTSPGGAIRRAGPGPTVIGFPTTNPDVDGSIAPPGLENLFDASPMAHAMGFRSFGPPGLPMNLPTPAIARIETGSLTPTLSRRERVSRITRDPMPGTQPSEPSRLVPANAWLNLPTPAAPILLLPPGEGRDEGRPLYSSLLGSWIQLVSKSWRTPEL